MKRWIVTALGKDRPGIVAGVTQALYRLGANLEDSAMRRLEGEFAIMLIFSVSASHTEETLRQAFAPLQQRMTLAVHLKRLSPSEIQPPRKLGRPYLISVYGSDRTGIVYRISQALSRAGINITDVHTHRSSGVGASLYLLLLEVEIPKRVKIATLERSLKQLGKRLGIEVTLSTAEPAVL